MAIFFCNIDFLIEPNIINFRESTMFKELQIHYSEEHNTKTSWKVGEQCVTELGHKYVRGKILAIVNATQYKIYLVDEVIFTFLNTTDL